jgi:hypothetical protein
VREGSAAIALRVAAAAIGGYALANTLSIALAAAFPLVRAEAALFALEISFVVHAGAVLWAFAARSAPAAWAGLLMATMLSGAVAWVLV